jgi:hypothetical protein
MKDVQGHQWRSSHPVYGIIVYQFGKFLKFKRSNYEIILAYKRGKLLDYQWNSNNLQPARRDGGLKTPLFLDAP